MSHIFSLLIIVTLSAISLAYMENPAINITIADTIPDYLVPYPNSSVIKIRPSKVLLIPFLKECIFGTLTGSDNIRLAEDSKDLKFPALQDVTVEYKYPSNENMAVISGVKVWFYDYSNPNDCYITSIGKRNSSFSVRLEFKATKRLKYGITFLGQELRHYPSTNVEHPFTKIQIDDEIEQYLTLYPFAFVILMSQTMYDRNTTRYYLGNLLDTDQLVSTAIAEYSFPIVQDVVLSLDYPQVNKAGANITYVDVLLTESDVGKATVYVISGGIGQNYLKLRIQSKSSTIFNYVCKIYGYLLE